MSKALKRREGLQKIVNKVNEQVICKFNYLMFFNAYAIIILAFKEQLYGLPSEPVAKTGHGIKLK